MPDSKDNLNTADEFIANWAKLLQCKPEPYAIAVKLINVNKNYQTAMALVFGLSWATHKDWLREVTEYFQSNWNADTDMATIEWLSAFVDHYVQEVKAYPEDG